MTITMSLEYLLLYLPLLVAVSFVVGATSTRAEGSDPGSNA